MDDAEMVNVGHDFEQFLNLVLQELNPDGSLTAIGEIANVRVSGLVFFISFKA